ncbi:hypothetical protein [Salinarimonas sp.]
MWLGIADKRAVALVTVGGLIYGAALGDVMLRGRRLPATTQWSRCSRSV